MQAVMRTDASEVFQCPRCAFTFCFGPERCPNCFHPFSLAARTRDHERGYSFRLGYPIARPGREATIPAIQDRHVTLPLALVQQRQTAVCATPTAVRVLRFDEARGCVRQQVAIYGYTRWEIRCLVVNATLYGAEHLHRFQFLYEPMQVEDAYEEAAVTRMLRLAPELAEWMWTVVSLA